VDNGHTPKDVDNRCTNIKVETGHANTCGAVEPLVDQIVESSLRGVCVTNKTDRTDRRVSVMSQSCELFRSCNTDVSNATFCHSSSLGSSCTRPTAVPVSPNLRS